MFREGKRCAIYVRVSTEMQADGFSLDAQKNTLKRYAEREGMIIKEIYEDAGKSGKSIEGRPAFKKLLKDIDNGLAIDYVLVYKLSRFGRNAADILNSLEFIQSYDINLIATEEGIDSSQTSGKLLISVLSAVSEIERENILEQTMNGRKEKARQGGWNGGFAPYGYELINGEITIIPEEAEIVKRIFDDFTNKNIAMGKIAKNLNLEGILRPVRKNITSERWNKSSIKNILCNPIYKGVIAFGRRKKEKVKGTRNQYRRVANDNYIVGEGKHDAIITQEVWDKASGKLMKYVKKNNSQPFKSIYLLTGKLRCPCCGGTMFAQKNRWTLLTGEVVENCYYKCSNAYKTEPTCTNKRRIDQQQVDDFVIKFITERITNGFIAEEIAKRNKVIVDTSKYEKELKNYKTKLELILNKKSNIEYEIDNMPLDTTHYERKIHDLNIRLYKLYDDIAELEDRINDVELLIKGLENSDTNTERVLQFLSMFKELVHEMTDEERKKCIDYIINDITFNSDFAIDSINFNIGKPNTSTELEEMILGRVDDIRIDLNVKIPQSNTLYMTLYDPHASRRPRTRRVTVKQKAPIKTTILDESGNEITVHKYAKGNYIPKERPNHYNRKQATYTQIKEYIMEKYNTKIHTVYIAEVKRMHGVDMQANRRKTEAKYNCPKDKVAMIEDALKHFEIIK